MLTFSRTFSVLALAALRVTAQPSNETQVPFALQSPGQLCKNTTIVWQGGQSPYKVSLKPVCGTGKNASEEVHVVLVPGTTSIELPIQFPADTSIIVSITDSQSMQATAPETTVVSGDANDSCSTQNACIDIVTAPTAPVALADTSNALSTPAIPTDHLLTADPSARTELTADPSATESTMVVLYSYAGVSQISSTSTGAAAGASTTDSSQLNGTIPKRAASTLAVLGCIALVGANLAFGLW